jgi:hypothetical protein
VLVQGPASARERSQVIASSTRPASSSILASPGDPRQDPPLPPGRLDPLADRHPPHRASRVQETGRFSGADGSVVTGTPYYNAAATDLNNAVIAANAGDYTCATTDAQAGSTALDNANTKLGAATTDETNYTAS